MATLEEAQTWCDERNLTIQHQQFLTTQRHTFSHYHLDFTPLWLEVQSKENLNFHTRQQWQNRALPAPINTLLTQITEDFL
jgi:A/G-specific adenine glycosylase